MALVSIAEHQHDEWTSGNPNAYKLITRISNHFHCLRAIKLRHSTCQVVPATNSFFSNCRLLSPKRAAGQPKTYVSTYTASLLLAGLALNTSAMESMQGQVCQVKLAEAPLLVLSTHMATFLPCAVGALVTSSWKQHQVKNQRQAEANEPICIFDRTSIVINFKTQTFDLKRACMCIPNYTRD